MTEMKRVFTPAEILRLLGWTDTKAGEMLGCSHMTIQRKKKGISKWSATDIKILCSWSKIPIEYVSF